MHRWLLAWTAAFFASTTALAQTCDPKVDGTGEFVAAVEAAAAARGAALPAGAVALEDLRATLDGIAADGGTLRDFFLLLGDGQPRSIAGEDFRQVMSDYQISLAFLPTDDLVEIDSDGQNLRLLFDFGDDDDKEVEIGGTEYWALVSPGEVERKRSSSRTLSIHREFDVQLGPDGVESIEDGDLSVSVAFFWLDLAVRTERTPDRVLADEDGDAVVVSDAYGQPLMQDGSYVVWRYDDWFVLSAAGNEGRLGIPPLTPRSPP